jgi:hypothetical protein
VLNITLGKTVSATTNKSKQPSTRSTIDCAVFVVADHANVNLLRSFQNLLCMYEVFKNRRTDNYLN